MSITIFEVETQKGNEVDAVEFVNGDTTTVIWDYKRDGLGLTWRRKVLELDGKKVQVIAGFETSHFFTHFLTMDDLLVRAGLMKNSQAVREKNRCLRIALATQMKEGKERHLARRQEAVRIIDARRQAEEQIMRRKQEAARLVREEEVRAEKERQRAARKLEVNSRSRVLFWKDGQQLEGIPVKEEEIPALAPIRRDRDDRKYVFAVVMENGEPARVVKVMKSPSGRPIQHEINQVSFDEPVALQPSSSGSNGNSKSAPSKLPEIRLYTLDGRLRSVPLLEPSQMTRPEVLRLLKERQLVAVNQRNNDGQYPLYQVEAGGALSKGGPLAYCHKAPKGDIIRAALRA